MNPVNYLPIDYFKKLLLESTIEFTSMLRVGCYGVWLPDTDTILLKDIECNSTETHIDTVVHELLHKFHYYNNEHNHYEDKIEQQRIEYTKKYPEVKELVKEQLTYARELYEFNERYNDPDFDNWMED